jgi:CRISPR-associated protein Csb2
MLAFGIRYHNGFVAARATPDDIEAEWPPHPGRVFMALAAAHFHTGADVRERAALLWLEALEKDGEPAAPLIVAADAMHRQVVTQYAPVNDKAGPSKALLQSAPLTRERQPRTFTRAWLADDTVFLLWPDAEPDGDTRTALEALCAAATAPAMSALAIARRQAWLPSTLYHDRGARHRREALAQTFHVRIDLIRRTQVEDQDVVFPAVDCLLQAARQLGAAPRGQPALEHGELQPAAVAVHQLEDAAPALVVRDVVGDDVEPLFDHVRYRTR